MTEDDIQRWERTLTESGKALGSKSGSDPSETVHADAYQQLVKLGVRRQLRKKYRA